MQIVYAIFSCCVQDTAADADGVALTGLPHLFDNNKKFCYNIYRKRKEVFYMNNFDDFDLYPQVEEFYDDAEYWEAIMNEEMYDDKE